METPKLCPCGGQPVVSAVSANRVAKRETALARYDAASAVPHASGAALKEFQNADRDLNALAEDACEVRCPKCGTFYHEGVGRLGEIVALWDGVVDQYAARAACCKDAANLDLRTDPDGMVIAKCRKCESRHIHFGSAA